MDCGGGVVGFRGATQGSGGGDGRNKRSYEARVVRIPRVREVSTP